MYSAAQIARAAAPAKTNMAMPAHLEAMITAPAKPRSTFTPVKPVVDIEAIEAGRAAKEIADQAVFARIAKLSADRERHRIRQIELAMKRERTRRIRLGILTDYRKSVERPQRLVGILSEVAKTSIVEIKGKCRERPIVHIRHIACWLLHKHCTTADGNSIGYPRIGRFMGGRDHTTILHAVRRVKSNPEMRSLAADLEREVLEIEEKRYGGV